VTFGLGRRDRAQRVIVEWPSGLVQEFGPQKAGSWQLTEGAVRDRPICEIFLCGVARLNPSFEYRKNFVRWLALAGALGAGPALAQTRPAAAANQALLEQYCVGCHNNRLNTAGVTLEGLDLGNVSGKAAVLEKVLRKVKSGQMPPAGLPRPEPAVAAAFGKWLETSLDAEAMAHPDPGRTAIHRLNRAEYSNAVRDIFALDVSPGSMLPVDDSGYGFDNIGDVLSVSPSLFDRYISVAHKVSRLAVGDLALKPVEETFEPRRQTKAERVSDDLPFNSSGGLSVRYYFPVDAEYVFRIRSGPQNAPSVGTPLEFRLPVKAGLHTAGATFPAESLKTETAPAGGGRRAAVVAAADLPAPAPLASPSLDLRLDGARVKRFDAPGNGGGPPQLSSLSIAGPYNILGRGDTPSRARIFICRPTGSSEEAPCAQKILANLARLAYRRPVTDADVRPLIGLYQDGRRKGDFDSGIQEAIQGMLVAPDFIFRVEIDPKAAGRGGAYRISDIELASRLSFFLWSSIPDDTLLNLAVAGKLSNPTVLDQQVRRMLDDPKSSALVSNFAGQWLFIRNLATVRPDPVAFPDWDESLRAGFQAETELFFESVLRENRSVLDLLTANYTFLNERLAKHYGIPGIYGSQLRRVTLDDPNRGGLLGQGSLLTVTSYPNRTSVVQRGKWILENLLGTPPPPPPADVPTLEATTANKHLSLREAMEQHRANPACAGCHARMDPIGFALENYDGIGKWRAKDGGTTIDASGRLPDGTQFDGPAGLRKVMTTARRDEFVSTVAEKLLTYSLGRGVEPYDRPTLRAIVRESERNNYRLADLVEEIVKSTPFQMRRFPEP
jgi:mono/diheme cytochrome c family protein